jgi:hypothetical protein
MRQVRVQVRKEIILKLARISKRHNIEKLPIGAMTIVRMDKIRISPILASEALR